MWTQVTGMRGKRFTANEDGALLVFFAMSCAAIFLIAALSFDLGKRASTQSELQSYADNVALAAAGELDGFTGAMDRAALAAANLVQDSYVFGDDGDGDRILSGAGDYTLLFYETLPDDEDLWAAVLDPNNPANDVRARYARVIVEDVSIPWSFANILSVFSSAPPNPPLNAEATAGFTSFACDVTPFFFCMPNATGKDSGAGADSDTPVDSDGNPIWYPANHVGETVLLRTGGGGGSLWGPGNFGWLDVRDAVPQDIVDESSDCAGITSQTELLTCLIAAENSGIACFQNGLLSTLTGQAVGIESAVFNTRFDIYSATSNQNEGNPNFAPAPLNMKGVVPKNSGDVCIGNNPTVVETKPLPIDDCFVSASGNCQTVAGVKRFGDGGWEQGRIDYVDANYSFDVSSIGIVNPADYSAGGDIVTIGGYRYHVDDPFRPDGGPAKDAKYAGLPQLPGATATRFQYYSAEVEAVYAGVADGANVPLNNPLMGPNRSESGLPSCATQAPNQSNYSRDPARRNFVAAVVDCAAESVRGNTQEVRATYFIEVFLPQRIEGVSNFDLFVEIVDGPLNKGEEEISKGTFRNMIQLYR